MVVEVVEAGEAGETRRLDGWAAVTQQTSDRAAHLRMARAGQDQ